MKYWLFIVTMVYYTPYNSLYIYNWVVFSSQTYTHNIPINNQGPYFHLQPPVPSNDRCRHRWSYTPRGRPPRNFMTGVNHGRPQKRAYENPLVSLTKAGY